MSTKNKWLFMFSKILEKNKDLYKNNLLLYKYILKFFFFFFLAKLNITNIYFQIRSFRIREDLKGFTKQFFLKLTLKLFLYIYINSIVNNNEFKIKC